MRVALVHDWLTGRRGGEKVLEVFCELFPEATIFTLVHVEGSAGATIESHPIRTAFTQRLPFAASHYRWYLPLFPTAIESLSLEGYDLVLSSSHCVAKGARAPSDALHICYCHTPMRYVWDRFPDYFGNGLAAKAIFGPVARRLRLWDERSASRVHHFVANSTYVADRIRRYYHREAEAIIAPPVDTDFFTPDESAPSDYYLIVSALVPYKRIELAIEAFAGRTDTLIVAGAGPSSEKLRALAGANVRFLGWVDDATLRDLYRRCRACLLPGVEDFGIAPVEAQACGVPVIAFAEGGARDSVREGETGVLFREPTAGALSSAIDKLSALRLNKNSIREWALGFSRESFATRMKEFIRSRIGER